MPYYKDPAAGVHYLDDARYRHLLPADAVEISYDEAVALRMLSIDDLRERRIDDIGRWRDDEEAADITFEHAGRVWDGGLRTRVRLQPVLSLPGLPAGFFWTDSANNDVPMSRDDLLALHYAHEAAIVLRGFEIHVRQRVMKAEVLELQTAAELSAYLVGWPSAVEEGA